MEEIIKYKYYDETGNYIAIIDKEKLQELLKVDEVKFEEQQKAVEDGQILKFILNRYFLTQNSCGCRKQQKIYECMYVQDEKIILNRFEAYRLKEFRGSV